MSNFSSATCRCPKSRPEMRPSGLVICMRCGGLVAMVPPPKKPKP